ncbi:Hypothetical predicted protein [Mytilus galloprovincialis]|uniref:B box-type domain-containing protein n=1 Tax=Mytilus galloprovincialis TaxID=29158 RepID=A0A8B6FJF8_MYTGA|nr:Hypothetical predicted protein [Mytilus galloprovincialis]
MALSKTVKGQTPLKCKLCEIEGAKIKWKCLNCIMLMCTNCKDNIHVKFKLAKDHKIIDIKEAGDCLEEPDFTNLICDEHTGESCVMFCSTCDRLVCTTCISILHNGHGLVKIDEGYRIKMERYKTDRKKSKEKIKELKNIKENSNEVRMKDSAQYKELIKKIEAQNIKIKKEADKYTEELIVELKEKWGIFQKEELNDVEKVVTNLKELRSNEKRIIQSMDTEKIFTDCGKLSMAVNEIGTRIRTISFLPGQMSPYHMGSLQIVSNVITINIVKQFQTDMSELFNITVSPDRSLWISDNSVLQKVKPVKHKLIVESTMKMEIYGTAATVSGDILMVTHGPVLKQISGRTGKITDSVYRVNKLFNTAIHVTKDGKVIVGVKDGGKSWPATGRRAIVVMNQKGDHETIYEHDKNNIRIFTYPESVTSTDNGNICVVDWLSDDCRGRVVVLSQDGDILQIFRGHPDINNESKPYRPMQIITTPSDNLIVTQLNLYIFYILNNCGHLITHCNVGEMSIQRPYSLCFTKTPGQLYIGCTKVAGSSDKGKLFEVNINGC